MALSKRLQRSEFVQAALAVLIALYIRLVHLTTSWTVVRPPRTKDILAEGRPFIGCFWHGRMVVMIGALPRDMELHTLISEHPDGLLISRAIRRLGVHTVEAPRKRGRFVAVRAIQRVLDEGYPVAITPDGPRGPRMRAKLGAVKAAQLSGVPILPVSGTVSRRRILPSWDRFCLPFPFARGVIFWGEPIEVPSESDEAGLERLREELEERLNALTAEADRHFGQPVIEPAARGAAHARTGHARA